jgi:hypothetical protein
LFFFFFFFCLLPLFLFGVVFCLACLDGCMISWRLGWVGFFASTYVTYVCSKNKQAYGCVKLLSVLLSRPSSSSTSSSPLVSTMDVNEHVMEWSHHFGSRPRGCIKLPLPLGRQRRRQQTLEDKITMWLTMNVARHSKLCILRIDRSIT